MKMHYILMMVSRTSDLALSTVHVSSILLLSIPPLSVRPAFGYLATTLLDVVAQ